MRRTWMLVLAALLAVCAVSAQGYDRPPKKLIEYGWDVPYPDFLKEHLPEMITRPFDGLIFRLRTNHMAFDLKPWAEADLMDQAALLKDADWGPFTDNFLCLYAANNQGMDWFDDGQWATIAANLALESKAAAALGCVGICWDPEPYGDNPWVFPGKMEGKTFAEAEAIARKRGAQFIAALQSELPELRLLTFFQLSLFGGLADLPDPADRQQKLSSNGYALLPAFLNGMLDACGPGVQIIDGNESSYYYTNSEGYYAAYQAMKQRSQSFIAPENRAAYRAHVQAGMALYVDQVLGLRAQKVLGHYLDHDQQLRWFEHNVYYALRSTDEYVWLYSEKMNWWQNQVPDGLDEAVRSARDKVAAGRPLGFDLVPIIEAGKRNQQAELEARLVRRSAEVKPLPAGVAAPTVDGDLGDPIWQQVPALEPFLAAAASAAELKAATTAQVAYDDTNLYLAFHCAEPTPAKMVIAGNQKDDQIWNGETVELFLSLGEATAPYRHFILNPHNVPWDGSNTEAGDDSAWNAEWQSGAKVGQAEWTAELAIPWSALGGKPAAGSTRRVNLCHARTAERELSAWSTVANGFVEPERFGTWTFGGP